MALFFSLESAQKKKKEVKSWIHSRAILASPSQMQMAVLFYLLVLNQVLNTRKSLGHLILFQRYLTKITSAFLFSA